MVDEIMVTAMSGNENIDDSEDGRVNPLTFEKFVDYFSEIL